jgi:hypothetical protein
LIKAEANLISLLTKDKPPDAQSASLQRRDSEGVTSSAFLIPGPPNFAFTSAGAPGIIDHAVICYTDDWSQRQKTGNRDFTLNFYTVYP